uniref:Microsomal glutathione S-transferase 1 n=1 Tax=Equus asinus TaxID=9793 RepID=A0A9L0JYL0_EQUAS
ILVRTIALSSERSQRPCGGVAIVCTAPPGDQTLAFQCGKRREHRGVSSFQLHFLRPCLPHQKFLITTRFWRYFSEKEFPESPLCIFNSNFFFFTTSTCNCNVSIIHIPMAGTEQDPKRSERAHLNDLENIVPFLGIGLLYSLSGPDLSTAILHFRIFVGARIYHTIAYLTPLPQPNRALAFFVGYGVTLSMAYRLLKGRLYL